MKNKAFKLVLTIVIVGVLVFGASFAKAQTTTEDMIKMLQSLVQVLMQMVAQLQAQLAQKITPPTTIPILQQTCDSICEAKRYQSGNCIGSSSEGASPTCPVGDINIGQTTGCSKAEAPSAIGMPTCCCSNKIKYSCTTAMGTIPTNNYSTCVPDPNGAFNSLAECQNVCTLAPRITVLSPNGTEIFLTGSLMTITWSTTNYRNSVVNIDLYRSNTIPGKNDYHYVTQIGSLAQPNDGVEMWTIPSTIETGNNYFIHVTMDVKDPEAGLDTYDDSDKPFSIVAPSACTDSDGGNNPYVKGTAIGADGSTVYTDSCVNVTTLKEHYCSNNQVLEVIITCPSGYACQDGACKLTTTNLKPDLIITQISLAQSSNPKVGDVYAYFNATIKNIGTAVATPVSTFYGGLDVVCGLNSYPTSFSDPNLVLGVMFTSPLAPNATITSYRAPTGADSSILKSSGNKHIYCTVDPYNKISELNENNNNYDFYITVDPNPTTNCIDSDGGKNYYVKGTVTYGSLTYNDYCSSSNSVGEYYCENNVYYWMTYTCPAGYTCQDGACKIPSTALRAELSGPPTLNVLQSGTYIVYVSGGTPPYYYEWSADGNIYAGGVVGTYKWSKGGIYPVVVKVTDSKSAIYTVTLQVKVEELSASINDTLNKLSASLISLIELLKR